MQRLGIVYEKSERLLVAWVCPSYPQNEDPRIKFYLALFEEKVSVLPSSGQQGLCLMHAIMSGEEMSLSYKKSKKPWN